MPLFAIGYTFEPTPGTLTTGCSYRGSQTMTQDEATGIIFGVILKEFPGAKVLNIAAMEVLPEDIAKAVSWSAMEPAAQEGEKPNG